METVTIVIIVIIIIIMIWLMSKSTEKFAGAPKAKILLSNNSYQKDRHYTFEHNNNYGHLRGPNTNLYVTTTSPNTVTYKPFNSNDSNQLWSYRPNNQGKLASAAINGRYLKVDANGNLGLTQANKNATTPGLNWNELVYITPGNVTKNFGNISTRSNLTGNSVVGNITGNSVVGNITGK
jgi:hypothetical protein